MSASVDVSFLCQLLAPVQDPDAYKRLVQQQITNTFALSLPDADVPNIEVVAASLTTEFVSTLEANSLMAHVADYTRVNESLFFVDDEQSRCVCVCVCVCVCACVCVCVWREARGGRLGRAFLLFMTTPHVCLCFGLCLSCFSSRQFS